MKKGDFLIILLIAVLEAALMAVFLRGPSPGGVAVIELDNAPVHSVPLDGGDRDYEIQGAHGQVVVSLRDGRVSFSESSCPDQTCVRTGRLSRAGQTAACVPNRVLIRIDGAPDGGPDVVLR